MQLLRSVFSIFWLSSTLKTDLKTPRFVTFVANLAQFMANSVRPELTVCCVHTLAATDQPSWFPGVHSSAVYDEKSGGSQTGRRSSGADGGSVSLSLSLCLSVQCLCLSLSLNLLLVSPVSVFVRNCFVHRKTYITL